MTAAPFPVGHADDRELLLEWLGFLRGAVLRKVEGLDEAQARWRPEGRLIPLLGIVNHLTHVEWRWIDGEMLGQEVSRSEEEFNPGPGLSLEGARRLPDPSRPHRRRRPGPALAPAAVPSRGRHDLRWVLLHLINETARHAGHADAVRELLDGTTGESAGRGGGRRGRGGWGGGRAGCGFQGRGPAPGGAQVGAGGHEPPA